MSIVHVTRLIEIHIYLYDHNKSILYYVLYITYSIAMFAWPKYIYTTCLIYITYVNRGDMILLILYSNEIRL